MSFWSQGGGGRTEFTNTVGTSKTYMTIALFSKLSTSAVASATGVYTLRAVRGGQAQRVINVRRGTDDATQDFYADVYGNLFTDPTQSQTITTWLGAATGYITTWYDQSGGSNNATQVTTASQPIIDVVNKQVDFKTSRWFNLPNGTVPYGNQNYTMVVRHNTVPTTVNNEYDFVSSGTNGTTNLVNSLGFNSFFTPYPVYINYWWGNDVNSNPAVNRYAPKNTITALYNNTVGVGRTLYVNGTVTGTNTATNRNSATGNNAIGKDARNFYINGELYYVFLFNSALSNSDRQLVEAFPIS